MKKGIFLLFSLFGMFALQAQGIEFFEGTWEEALAEAERQEKIIFVDAYAVWCGPCKRMANNVFTHERVGEFYNEQFINVKMDMERGEGLSFRQKYPVSAFPTLFYIDYNGEVVHKVKGAQQVDGFIQLGELALRKVDRSGMYSEEYEDGNREPQLVYNYVKALNQAGKSSLRVSNEYIRSQDDLNTDQNLRFLLEAAVEADSRLFSLMIEHRKAIEALEGKQAVLGRIEQACANTAQKAIEFESLDLLEEAKRKMKEHYPARAMAFGMEAEMDYYRQMGDHKNYLKACTAYSKKVVSREAPKLHSLAREIEMQFEEDEKCMKEAERLAREAAEQGETYSYFYTYARILYKNGKKEEALEAANKSLKLAEQVGTGSQRMVQELIQKIEG